MLCGSKVEEASGGTLNGKTASNGMSSNNENENIYLSTISKGKPRKKKIFMLSISKEWSISKKIYRVNYVSIAKCKTVQQYPNSNKK